MSVNNLEDELTELLSHVCMDEISEMNFSCRNIIIRCIHELPHCNSTHLIKIQAAIDYTYEMINIGDWRKVQYYLRKTMTIASFIKLLIHLRLNKHVYSTEKLKSELFKIIDYGLLFGCPLSKEPNLLQRCATVVNQNLIRNISNYEGTIEDIRSDSSYFMLETHGEEIEKIVCPSMEDFFNNYIVKEKPVVLLNCIDHWPALTKWKDQSYLLKLAGSRTVPIELGSKYTDSDWTQKLMTLGEFIEKHIFNTNEQTGYLAQYKLFNHIPELKQDISEPEYCCFSDTNELIDINAWFGPEGTLSPLHHDPKRNLLAQVVGKKRIFIFSPEDTEYIYPHDEELLNNTAKVDPRMPNCELYPAFKNAKPLYCILKPGEMLYIPPKWWHFVESLSVSFSVSFWWT